VNIGDSETAVDKTGKISDQCRPLCPSGKEVGLIRNTPKHDNKKWKPVFAFAPLQVSKNHAISEDKRLYGGLMTYHYDLMPVRRYLDAGRGASRRYVNMI
jgi:hypothetical protein